jgi:hypothetical protein
MGADNVVVLDSDRNRLCVAEAAARRMAAATSVVVVEPAQLVEPEQAAEIGERRIERAPEPGHQLGLDRAGESRVAKSSLNSQVEVVAGNARADVSKAVHATAICRCPLRDVTGIGLIEFSHRAKTSAPDDKPGAPGAPHYGWRDAQGGQAPLGHHLNVQLTWPETMFFIPSSPP